MFPEGITNLAELTQLVKKITHGEFYSEDVLCIEYGQGRSWVIEIEVAARKANLLTGSRNMLWYFPASHNKQNASPQQYVPGKNDHIAKYNDLTGEQKQDLRENLAEGQQWTCSICRKPFSEVRKPHLDHCHETGKVRGLLCSFCNIGLGCFSDSILSLENAIAYLLEAATLKVSGSA